MKNYRDSDYALNKFSGGIVYRFADWIVEITLEDYLAESSGKTGGSAFYLGSQEYRSHYNKAAKVF